MSTVTRTTTTQRRKKSKQTPASTTVTKVTQSKPRKKTKSSNKAGQSRAVSMPCLSGCARDYARALVNPFTGPLACVPSFPALMTRRMRCWSKGTFTTSSTNSFGYILAEPTNMVVNDVDAVACSTAASNVTVAANTVAGDPNIALFRSNSEYVQAQIGSGAGLVQYRIVAMGIRIRYIGTNLNQGGIINGLHEPDHDTLVGNGISQFDAQTEARRLPVTRNWATVVFKPVNSVNFNFANATGGSSTNTAWYMGFVLQSAVPSQTYEFEVYAIYELEGRIIRGKTPSHADPVGLSSVTAVAATTDSLYPTLKPAEASEKSMVDQATDYLGSMMSNAGINGAKIGQALGETAAMYASYRNVVDAGRLEYH